MYLEFKNKQGSTYKENDEENYNIIFFLKNLVQYGNTGCRFFKRGYKIRKIFA